MRVLLVEMELTGHHRSYMEALRAISADDIEMHVAAPFSKGEMLPTGCHVLRYEVHSFFDHLRWLRELRNIVKTVSPDIIHYLYGDALYRYGGMGIRLSSRARIVTTCHQIRRSELRDISYRLIACSSDAVVVHTRRLKEELESMGMHKLIHIEYPQFSNTATIDKQEAMQRLGIADAGVPVIAALGGTRRDKGLDLLLQALKKVHAPFHLLIAGKEQTFTREDIEGWTTGYGEHVTMQLDFLSDEMFSVCLNAADIIALPYRKSFDGASGPLGEGVAHGKLIVGADHGSLGQIIRDNHLGFTFLSEDIQSLSENLDKALTAGWQPDERYLAYQQILDPERFKKEYLAVYAGLTEKGAG